MQTLGVLGELCWCWTGASCWHQRARHVNEPARQWASRPQPAFPLTFSAAADIFTAISGGLGAGSTQVSFCTPEPQNL